MHKPLETSSRLPGRQRGALTMFSAVMILLLLSELIVYAVSGGIFEQQKSANDMRQKLAFHTAEAGLNHAREFMFANRVLVVSTVTDLLANGSDGWFSAGAERWISCEGVTTASGEGSHPCYGESIFALREGSYYYSFGGSTELPLNTDGIIIQDPTKQVNVQALLCMTEMDFTLDPVVQGCTTDGTLQDDRYFVVTLLAQGEADCDGGTCSAEALVIEKVASTAPGSGGTAPGVPLTSKTTFPPQGTAELVPNPNGYGVGVPVSAWLNNNSDDCPIQVVDADSGTWSTCEREEWYGVDEFPDDYTCPWASCSCAENQGDLILSDEDFLNFDIALDEGFPCDLFLFVFGEEKTPEGIANVKGMATVINDCGDLDEYSSGVFWVTGDDCDIQVQVGTAETPVLLISAALETRFNAGAEIFGMVFITDAEELNATFEANGHATVYGAAIIDATMGNFNGTFQIVYLENVIEKALGTGGLGVMAGGWTDFHDDWQ